MSYVCPQWKNIESKQSWAGMTSNYTKKAWVGTFTISFVCHSSYDNDIIVTWYLALYLFINVHPQWFFIDLTPYCLQISNYRHIVVGLRLKISLMVYDGRDVGCQYHTGSVVEPHMAPLNREETAKRDVGCIPIKEPKFVQGFFCSPSLTAMRRTCFTEFNEHQLNVYNAIQ